MRSPTGRDFKSLVSTYSTTRARLLISLKELLKLKTPNPIDPGSGFGAEDGTRTRDPNLGKVMLYQLSYFRFNFGLQK